MAEIKIPDCQYCKSTKWMRLAGDSPDHIAFHCLKCGCVRAWSTPSNRSRSRAAALAQRLKEAEARQHALDSRPKYFDMHV